MLNSLRNRILLFTLLMLALLMSGIGVWLYQSFYSAQLETHKEKLRLHTLGLLASAELRDGRMTLPEYLPEGRFNSSGSGLFARLLDYQGNTLWLSPSARDLVMPAAVLASPGEWRFSLARLNDHEFLFARFGISWGDGEQSQYTLTLAEDLHPVLQQAADYRNGLITTLLLFGSLLLLMQWLILRWGLAPLRRVSEQLRLISEGRQGDLSGRYPQELTPLTSNLNLLLNNEQAQRERYRNQLADLSHSLKTPLAVMTGLIAQPALSADDRKELALQAELMSDRIRYQLQRAVNQASALSIHRTEVMPQLRSLVAALTKVYGHVPVNISLTGREVDFFGDENDLMEIAGNLVDNACKYGAGRVMVSVDEHASGWQLTVEDNGPGIATEQRQRILQRGVRLDSMVSGQGIGLALVSDLVSQHNGTISITDSELGGACFTVILPGSEDGREPSDGEKNE